MPHAEKVPYPLNTPLGRFGVETTEETPARCTATIPVAGLRNPLSGAATIAPLAMLVDHVGGLVNHMRREAGEWTVTSELALEVTPDALAAIASDGDAPVVAVARPFGEKDNGAVAHCELSAAGRAIATATVHSFYIAAPENMRPWPGREQNSEGSLPGTDLAALMNVQIGESGGGATVLMQGSDEVLNNLVGTVHGGVSAMGLELVATAALDTEGVTFRTGSLHVNYLRPFHGGAEAHYEGRTLRAGRSTGLAEARAVGHDGSTALVARLTAYR